MFEIPLLAVDRQSLTVHIAGLDLRLTVWWQPSTGGWYASAEVPVGTPQASGRRLVADGPLLGRQRGGLPGQIYCRPTGSARLELGPQPWGTTHRLVYEDA